MRLCCKFLHAPSWEGGQREVAPSLQLWEPARQQSVARQRRAAHTRANTSLWYQNVAVQLLGALA